MKKNHKDCPKFGYLTAIVSVIGGSAMASGFDVPDQDAFAIGRGLAFVATADNPSAIFYNPAGLTQLSGNNLRAGIYAIQLDPKFRSPGGTDYDNQNQWAALPHFFFSHSNEKQTISAGLGVYAPSGLSITWPDNTGFRTVGSEASLEQIAINPVLAIQVLPSLSIGAGVSANYVNLDLRRGLLWPDQPYDQFRFAGDGWAASGNFGVLWKPMDQLAFGASFQTGAKVHLTGHTTAENSVAIPADLYPAFLVRQSASANFQIPLKAKAGVSYRPTQKWNIEADAEYINWDTVDTLNLNQSAQLLPFIPKNVPIALDWKDSWYYELGATRYFDNGWHISAGYIFNQNSLSSANYNPLVADEDRHFFSFGLGYKGSRFDFDVAYQFGYGPNRTVSGAVPSAGGQTADGTYSFISHAVSASVGVNF